MFAKKTIVVICNVYKISILPPIYIYKKHLS